MLLAQNIEKCIFLCFANQINKTMKHLHSVLLIAAILVVNSLSGQSSPKAQRFVLLEQFTSSTCGPCASANPTIIQRLQQNPDKFTAIFYHVGWPTPGNDPMYLHNTADNNARVSYYSVNSVPRSVIDGNYYIGSPGGWSMTTINNRYAMPSPCEINLQHYLNAAQDSIFLVMLIKATENMTGSSLVAHNVVIEKLIQFPTPPGTNGEKDFHNVMKKLLPTAGGTALPSNLGPGDYLLLENAWKLANVYNNNQLAAIGFIQNNTNKEVLQTANSSTNPVTPLYANDAQVMMITEVAPQNCQGFVTPTIKVRNNGSNAMTSLKIKYKVNDGELQEYNWSGNTGLLSVATIALPAYNFPVEAQNTLKVFVDKINSVNDEYPKNDTLTFEIKSAKVATPELKLWIKTDNKPEETTWKIVDDNDNVMAEGGPYTQANTLIKEDIVLPGGKCYRFFMLDAGGDGVCCGNGLGFYTFFYGNNNVISEGTNFGSKAMAQFATESGVGITTAPAFRPAMRISPNPVGNEANLHFSIPASGKPILLIYNLAGQKMLSLETGYFEAGSHISTFSVTSLPAGLYVAELITPDGHTLRYKFSKK